MTDAQIKILIAEDDYALNRIMTSFMEDESFKGKKLYVDRAENGEEAIEFINKNKYRLVLLDINMPRKTGLEVLEELQSKADVPPILIFSNIDDEKIKEKALSLGAREYFLKEAVDIAGLRKIVKIYLEGEIK